MEAPHQPPRQPIKGPAKKNGKLYIYPEQYEGREADHLIIFCTGPVPAQHLEPLIPWLMQKSGARKIRMTAKPPNLLTAL
jgi:branched-chain amino acid transport system substrate-binding protein